MRNVLLTSAIAFLLILSGVNAGSSSASPDLPGLQLMTQLPAEVPQRITGFTYDGEKFLATIYQGGGSYVTLDPLTLQWTVNDDDEQRRAIIKVTGRINSPTAICFANGKLWAGGGDGQSFGVIDTNDWNVERIFPVKQRNDNHASQSYSSMTYDGANLWIAWHWCKYDLPVSQTQRLLKIDPDTGTTLAEHPLPPGSAPDLTHGLTWDGSRLWHAKDNKLSAIDPATGRATAQYNLPKVQRPSGLAWDGRALWIIEFEGKVWRLTL
jgi:outer membrane protein assembly factor BamB